MAQTAKDLSDAGFDIDDRLEAIGVIVGSADVSLAQSLRAIAGVIDVSPESSIDIGPPDSPIHGRCAAGS
ncbi:hypothetical protein BTZ20_2920 [Rhodococcus sp. MTM3W5.2]|uniref:hypothetical protein n=1 Tax=Rhodococcus sp. MTM3W5.2 TaxID=1805827 RepID=UPI00097926E5|nr:hypothetical protein [Rhodococcus sp. MTM3W5.2]AQA22347.1 hypothetical protein BTZ20_2920 [Rhodococcus sp. MTM3W5.2]